MLLRQLAINVLGSRNLSLGSNELLLARYEMAQTLIAFAEQKGVKLQTKVNEIHPIFGYL